MTTNHNPITEIIPVPNVVPSAIIESVPVTASGGNSETSGAIVQIPDAPTAEELYTKAPSLMTKQEQRYQLFRLFDPLRAKIETFVTSAVNARCSARYKGFFEVRFDNPNDITAKSVADFCMTGAVFFTADDLTEQAALKKIRKAEAGVNLSALMTRAKRPTNIDDAAWRELANMWNEVSTVLRIDGITPMHSIVTNALTTAGCGGPKINKKLGGGINANAQDMHVVMCQVLQQLASSLETAAQPS